MCGPATPPLDAPPTLGPAFTMAFQPIVDVARGAVFAHEALLRGPGGQGALALLSQVQGRERFAFDQRCHARAIELAAELGLEGRISVNFLPTTDYEPAQLLDRAMRAAEGAGIPLSRLIVEVTEGERVEDHQHLRRVLAALRGAGVAIAIDDFGAGYSGLAFLADHQPDIVKLDVSLVRGVDIDRPRRAIIGAVAGACEDLGVRLVAEGVETAAEMRAIQDLGIELMQGYLFARPVVGATPAVAWPRPLAA